MTLPADTSPAPTRQSNNLVVLVHILRSFPIVKACREHVGCDFLTIIKNRPSSLLTWYRRPLLLEVAWGMIWTTAYAAPLICAETVF